VRRWKFEPARHGGRAVEYRHTVVCNFSIDAR